MTTQEKIEDMFARYEKIEAGGGAKRVGKQHDAGKMTARERINLWNIAAPTSVRKRNIWPETGW